MDPHKTADEPTTRFTANLYDPLIGIQGFIAPNNSGATTWFNLAPKVAKSWQVSSDGLTYIFEIQEGILFHDGSLLDASAVKYSFDRATTINQNLSAQLVSPFISSTSVLDSSHVQVVLSKPYSAFLNVLSLLYIVNPAAIKPNVVTTGTATYGSNGDYGTAWLETHDAGSGPYMLTQRQPGVLTVEDRFPDYWGGWGPQYFDELRYNIIPDAATIVSDISSGAGDWMDYWESNDQYIALAGTAGVTVPEYVDPAGPFTILMNNQNQYLSNKSVRQAIAYAFDYNTCVNSVWEGLGSPSLGPLPPGMIGYDSTVQTYFPQNMSKAQQLMSASGFSAGEITLDCVINPGQGTRNSMALLLAQNCKSIGITINIVTIPFSQFESNLATMSPQDAYPMSMEAGSIPFPDPDTILTDFYYSPSWKSGTHTYYNCSFYENPQVDSLIEQGRTAAASQRDAIYKQAFDLIVGDCASLWPIYNYTMFALRSDIGGFSPKPFYFTNVDQFRRNGWYRLPAPTPSPWEYVSAATSSTST